jgi:hypothetical protein
VCTTTPAGALPRHCFTNACCRSVWFAGFG